MRPLADKSYAKALAISISFFIVCGFSTYLILRQQPATVTYTGPIFTIPLSTPSIPPRHEPRAPLAPQYPHISPQITYGTAEVVSTSTPDFAYPHGIAIADGQFFIGMADQNGNQFSTNRITIFPNPSNLADTRTLAMRDWGGVEDMTYDSLGDMIYFILSDNNRLEIYSLNPHTYWVSTIISTSTVNAGRRPAITTDGTYVYGITNTTPSTVFKVKISDGTLTFSSSGHIANGHSAAIGIGPKTELYFGGGMANGFEKVDGETLQPIAKLDLGPNCTLGNDEAYDGTYVYIGCEQYPYGYRINVSDMSVSEFSLPGNSFGMFIYGTNSGMNLYNAAQDNTIDVFPDMNISDLHRYAITDLPAPVDTHNQSLEVNKIFFDAASGDLFFTAWWGVPGLFQIVLK